jgi:hypothetical protein
MRMACLGVLRRSRLVKRRFRWHGQSSEAVAAFPCIALHLATLSSTSPRHSCACGSACTDHASDRCVFAYPRHQSMLCACACQWLHVVVIMMCQDNLYDLCPTPPFRFFFFGSVGGSGINRGLTVTCTNKRESTELTHCRSMHHASLPRAVCCFQVLQHTPRVERRHVKGCSRVRENFERLETAVD